MNEVLFELNGGWIAVIFTILGFTIKWVVIGYLLHLGWSFF